MLGLQFPYSLPSSFFFFFNDTATTEIYTLSLHDALPIYPRPCPARHRGSACVDAHLRAQVRRTWPVRRTWRSEEHTSELQSRENLVCRLLLEKKNKKTVNQYYPLYYIKNLY